MSTTQMGHKRNIIKLSLAYLQDYKAGADVSQYNFEIEAIKSEVRPLIKSDNEYIRLLAVKVRELADSLLELQKCRTNLRKQGKIGQRIAKITDTINRLNEKMNFLVGD
jgi:hypothetical protein